MKHYIYTVLKGDTPLYVGLTTDLQKRLSNHKKAFGKDISIKSLEEYEGSIDTALALEQLWIRKFIEQGIILKNKPPKALVETVCYHCGAKTFQSSGKREKKYCSTSCRVMYNRINGKVEKKISAAIIHNQTMEALAEMKEVQKQIQSDLVTFGMARSDGKPLFSGVTANTEFKVIPVDDEPLSFDKLRAEIAPQTNGKPPKTVDQYMRWKRDCENEYDWQDLLKDLETNPVLNKKQKDFVKTANPSHL